MPEVNMVSIATKILELTGRNDNALEKTGRT